MAKVWVTYSWKDNEDQQINWIVQEMEKSGLEVHLDNRDIIPGRRLWDQISQAIADPEVCDSWIFIISPNSLASEPCREELSYALDRALNKRGKDFPLIGLVDGKFDGNSLPAALKVRLCVSTYETNWRQRILAGAQGAKPGALPGDELPPYTIEWHKVPEKITKANGATICLEVRPRVGTWTNFHVAVLKSEKDKVLNILHGARGRFPTESMVISGSTENETHFFRTIKNEVSPTQSAYINFKEKPSEILFGDHPSLIYTL